MDLLDKLKELITKAEAEPEPVSAPEPVVEAAQAPPTPQPVQTPETAPKPVVEAPAQEMDYAKELAALRKETDAQKKELAVLAQRPTHAMDVSTKEPELPKVADHKALTALYAKELTDDRGQFKQLDWINPNGWYNPEWRGTQGF